MGYSWLSGPCNDDDPPPGTVAFVDRPEGSDPDMVEESDSGVLFVDSRRAPRWPLTEQAIAQGEPKPLDLADEEPPVRGNRLLRELAEQSGGRMVEVEPGRWYESKD